jgi:excisionase family DNA binding protein
MNLQAIEERLGRIEEALAAQGCAHMSLDEAAAYLRVSRSYLYRLTSRSQIPHYKPGGKRIYFLKTDLDKWILGKRVASRAELFASAGTPGEGKRSPPV